MEAVPKRGLGHKWRPAWGDDVTERVYCEYPGSRTLSSSYVCIYYFKLIYTPEDVFGDEMRQFHAIQALHKFIPCWIL